jgi:hypothetical protein
MNTGSLSCACHFANRFYSAVISKHGKDFEMSFLSVLGKIAKIGGAVAPAAATAISPTAGAITGLVVNAVIKAEQAGGTGSVKKELVMKQVLPVVTPLILTLMQNSGTKVTVDPTGTEKAVSQIVDGVVALMNSLDAQTQATASS